jgi:hypothetical protein
MAVWQTPIYDRTNEDVQSAKTTIASWLADPSSAIVTDLKGCLNKSDMNRIEENMEYLREALISIGHSVPSMTFKTDWAYSDYSPLTIAWTTQNIERILSNLSLLKSYAPQGFIPDAVPAGMMHYGNINAIERITSYIYSFIQSTINGYRYSGTIYANDRA